MINKMTQVKPRVFVLDSNSSRFVRTLRSTDVQIHVANVCALNQSSQAKIQVPTLLYSYLFRHWSTIFQTRRGCLYKGR